MLLTPAGRRVAGYVDVERGQGKRKKRKVPTGWWKVQAMSIAGGMLRLFRNCVHVCWLLFGLVDAAGGKLKRIDYSGGCKVNDFDEDFLGDALSKRIPIPRVRSN